MSKIPPIVLKFAARLALVALALLGALLFVLFLLSVLLAFGLNEAGEIIESLGDSVEAWLGSVNTGEQR